MPSFSRFVLKTALLSLTLFCCLAHADNIVRTYAPIKAAREATAPEAPTSELNARYWRLLFTANNGSASNFVGIQELELRSSPGGADLTSPTTNISSSSYYAGDNLIPARAVDNNFSDYYHNFWLSATNAPYPHWLSLDMAAPVNVSEIAIWPQAFSAAGVQRAPRDFQIQSSPDGVTWATVKDIVGMSSWTLGAPNVISLN